MARPVSDPIPFPAAAPPSPPPPVASRPPRVVCDRCRQRYAVADRAPGTPFACSECGAILYTAGDRVPILADADARLAAAVRPPGPDARLRVARLEASTPAGGLAAEVLAKGLMDAEAWMKWLDSWHGAPRLLLNGYDLVRRLGRGGMGTVWHGRHLASGRPVAVKIMSPAHLANDDDRDRFLNEARVATVLDHPHIVKGYGADSVGPLPYYVMEYVHGQSTGYLLDKHGRFSERLALELGRQIALALSYAVRQGVVHRDIKPDNLLLTRNNIVKLADYGIASGMPGAGGAGEGTAEGKADARQSRQLFGTPAYVAPEQALGKTVDIRTDLYALGGTLFHLLTARLPFAKNTAKDMIKAHCNEPSPDPRELRPELSERTAQILGRLMAKDPGERYQSPEEMLAEYT